MAPGGSWWDVNKHLTREAEEGGHVLQFQGTGGGIRNVGGVLGYKTVNGLEFCYSRILSSAFRIATAADRTWPLILLQM